MNLIYLCMIDNGKKTTSKHKTRIIKDSRYSTFNLDTIVLTHQANKLTLRTTQQLLSTISFVNELPIKDSSYTALLGMKKDGKYVETYAHYQDAKQHL